MAQTLQQEIDNLRADISEWRRKIELAEAELRGLERAAKYLPAQTSTDVEKPKRSPRRGGRQPGAISNRWKAVLGELVGGVFDDKHVADVVFELENRRIKPTEVRRIFEGYIEHGYVEKTGDDLYRVTDVAIEKFDLEKEEGPDESGPQSDVGSVAERSIAPDSKSGGAAPEKPAPVGSNPTTSAPFNLAKGDLLASASSFGGPIHLDIPPLWKKGG